MLPGTYKRLLLRDYIRRSLYDPIHGYFSNSRHPVLQHDNKLLLRDIPTRSAYQRTIAATYARAKHGWMTPVELFSPFLSRAIANRVQMVAPKYQDIHIIEIGAGRGTLALDVLEYWSELSADFVQKVSYHIVEISPTLAQLQSTVLKGWIEKGIVTVYNADALVWLKDLHDDPEFRDKLLSSYCHIMGTEVLDNLPHDLVRERGSSQEMAVIVPGGNSGVKTRNAKLEWTTDMDPDTQAAMQAFGYQDNVEGSVQQFASNSWLHSIREQFELLLGGGTREIWVPTAAYQLMLALTTELPHAHITLSDFDSFPGALPGENGPVVQSVDRGSAIVYDCIQGAPFGKVDIMFPTNFSALKRSHESLCREDNNRYVRQITSQQQFFEDHSSQQDMKDTTCADGYNPILQDFQNASFLLVDCLTGTS